MAGTSVSGAASQAASSRAPVPVTVRSMTASRLPLRSPVWVRVSSSERRVAASISMTAPACNRRGAERRGSLPFCVSST